MTLLDKVLYLADYIEPGRSFEGVKALRGLAYDNINEAMILGWSSASKISEVSAQSHTNIPCKPWYGFFSEGKDMNESIGGNNNKIKTARQDAVWQR